MSESDFYVIYASGQMRRFDTVEQAQRAAGNEDFLWFDYHRPVARELLLLVDALGIHPLSIEDCTDGVQIPKIEDFHENYFILFNIFNYGDGELSIGEVDFIIGERFLVTVSGRGGRRKPRAGRQAGAGRRRGDSQRKQRARVSDACDP